MLSLMLKTLALAKEKAINVDRYILTNSKKRKEGSIVMENIKLETIAKYKVRLQKMHDIIKEHPFRLSFESQYMADYKHCLYALSEIWSGLIYKTAFDPEEKQLYRQFGYWIHDYRQELRSWRRDYFPMQYFDYYERMLQVTHIYIETGNMDTFYNIDCFFPDGREKRETRVDKVERYILVTKELCGIDSPILPKYFPADTTMETDDELIWECLDKECYPFYRWESDKKQELFESWKRDTKPVLEWLNAQHEETPFKHMTWRSLKMS